MTLSLVVLVITLYVAFVLLISAFVSRRATASTFFVGDRNQSVWMVTLAMISAAMSGVTYVSVPGMVLQQGFTYLQMALGFVVGQAVIAFVLVPLYYHLGVTSVYEYLERRFDLATRRCGALLFSGSRTPFLRQSPSAHRNRCLFDRRIRCSGIFLLCG